MLQKIRNFFGSLFPAAQPAPAPSAAPEPAAIVTRRVLMIVFDPVMNSQTGERLSARMKWRAPEALAASFLTDILEASGGLARYQVTQRIDAPEFPVKADGFRYTPQSYLAVLADPRSAHTPDLVDYNALLAQHGVLQKINRNEIDEVWLFGFPFAGCYESVMGGPGAFWCNSNPLQGAPANAARRFVVMGFSYERGEGEMLESFCHRVESVMERVFLGSKPQANLWQKFTRYDKQFPGQAECGTVHFAPNSQQDYDWNNATPVPSRCDDWYNFPNFRGAVKTVTAADWGSGDMRAHHLWWLKHLPKAAGRSNGIANNWWQYVMDVNRVR